MPAESPDAHRSGLRILVVDDNRDAADSLATLLQLMGHPVAVAYDGPAGLRAALTGRPDCVILDITMPGMDGYEVARRIRGEPGLAAVKLIALSAYSDAVHVQRVAAAGFDHRLTKPADPAELEELVAMLQRIKELAETTEQLARQNVSLADDTRSLLKEVKSDLKEVKEEIRELRDEVREIREEKKDE